VRCDHGVKKFTHKLAVSLSELNELSKIIQVVPKYQWNGNYSYSAISQKIVFI